MKNYIGTKIIKAKPMDKCTFLTMYKKEDCTNRETRNGYLVEYDNDYKSWSPKEVFESAYRLITDKELNLIKK
jgi:hypothetical protein